MHWSPKPNVRLATSSTIHPYTAGTDQLAHAGEKDAYSAALRPTEEARWNRFDDATRRVEQPRSPKRYASSGGAGPSGDSPSCAISIDAFAWNALGRRQSKGVSN